MNEFPKPGPAQEVASTELEPQMRPLSVEDTPTLSESGGANLFLRKQEDIPLVNLTREKNRVSLGDIGERRASLLNAERLKREINGLSAYAIEEIWCGIKGEDQEDSTQSMKEWIDQNPPGLLRINSDSSIHVLDHQYLMEKFKDKSLDEIFRYIESKLNETFFYHMKKWHEFRNKRLSLRDIKMTNGDQAFERYSEVIQERHKLRPFFIGASQIEHQIKAGMNNSVEIFTTVYDQIPKLFKYRFGAEVSETKYKEIITNSQPTLMKLASGELGNFSDLVNKSSLREGEKSLFVLVEKDGKLSIDLNLELVEEVESKPEEREVRTKCPALVAKGTDGRSMLLEVSKWISDIMEKYYFPRVVREDGQL